MVLTKRSAARKTDEPMNDPMTEHTNKAHEHGCDEAASISQLLQDDAFIRRHIGPGEDEIQGMLEVVGGIYDSRRPAVQG